MIKWVNGMNSDVGTNLDTWDQEKAKINIDSFNELINTRTIFLKWKLFNAKIYATKIDINDEIKRATRLTFKDKKIISYNKGSALNINFKAFKIISIIFIFYYNYLVN